MNIQFFSDTKDVAVPAFLKEMDLKINSLDSMEKEEFEERAAIMEYDGQLSREEAEWRALRIILENRIRIAV